MFGRFDRLTREDVPERRDCRRIRRGSIHSIPGIHIPLLISHLREKNADAKKLLRHLDEDVES